MRNDKTKLKDGKPPELFENATYTPLTVSHEQYRATINALAREVKRIKKAEQADLAASKGDQNNQKLHSQANNHSMWTDRNNRKPVESPDNTSQPDNPVPLVSK